MNEAPRGRDSREVFDRPRGIKPGSDPLAVTLHRVARKRDRRREPSCNTLRAQDPVPPILVSSSAARCPA